MLPQLTPDLSFDEASVRVLTYLQEYLPLALWSVTRVENGQQTFLYLNEDNSYRISRGSSARLRAGDTVGSAQAARSDISSRGGGADAAMGGA